MSQLNSVATFEDLGLAQSTGGMLLGEMQPHSDPVDATRRAATEFSSRRSPMGVEEASQYLGVGVRFIRRLIAERRIEHYKVGRLVRISPDGLDRYLESCRVPTSDEAMTSRRAAHG